MSNRGVTTIEAALMLVIACGIVTAGFFLIGVSFARHWIDFVVDESVACLDSGERRSECLHQAHARLGILNYGRLTRCSMTAASVGRLSSTRIDFEIDKPIGLSFIDEKTWRISRAASGKLRRAAL